MSPECFAHPKRGNLFADERGFLRFDGKRWRRYLRTEWLLEERWSGGWAYVDPHYCRTQIRKFAKRFQSEAAARAACGKWHTETRVKRLVVYRK